MCNKKNISENESGTSLNLGYLTCYEVQAVQIKVRCASGYKKCDAKTRRTNANVSLEALQRLREDLCCQKSELWPGALVFR